MTIASHFRDYPIDKIQARQLDNAMKEEAYAKLEYIIDKVAMHILNKPSQNWTRFEYINALKALFEMQQQLLDSKGWNASKQPKVRK